PFGVYTHQETVVSENLDEETRFPATVRHLRRPGLQSLCAIPLSDAHRRLGSLSMASARPEAYSPEDVRFGALAASQIALRVADAINFRVARRARDRLALLLDLTNRVVSKLNMREVLREICENIRRVMECASTGIAWPDPEDQKLYCYALDFPWGPSVFEEGRELPPAVKARVGKVLQSGEPMILPGEELGLSLCSGLRFDQRRSR